MGAGIVGHEKASAEVEDRKHHAFTLNLDGAAFGYVRGTAEGKHRCPILAHLLQWIGTDGNAVHPPFQLNSTTP